MAKDRSPSSGKRPNVRCAANRHSPNPRPRGLPQRPAALRPAVRPRGSVCPRKPTMFSFSARVNSARSIMAEALLEHWGEDGSGRTAPASFQRARCTPLALDLLEKAHSDTLGLRSKSWDAFAKPAAPATDFVFTVCDRAASEVCPAWPGNPVTAHWGVPDTAAVEGSEADKNRAFRYAFQALETRIKALYQLAARSARSPVVKTKSRRDRPPSHSTSEEPAS